LVFFAGQMHVDTTDRDSLGVEIDAKIANIEDRLRVPVRTAHGEAIVQPTGSVIPGRRAAAGPQSITIGGVIAIVA
jgi:hypothetical protein